MAEGFLDHLRTLDDFGAFARRLLSKLEQRSVTDDWARMLLKFPEAALDRIVNNADPQHAADSKWFAMNAKTRLHELRRTIARFTPWMLPDFANLHQDAVLAL